jgi:transcriptional regulator with XRE-family HTH domain/AraC-like DNA-binding protein
MPDEFMSPMLRGRRLAAELRRLREAQPGGPTLDDVARRLGWSTSRLSKYETARVVPKPEELSLLLDQYGVTDERKSELGALAEEAAGRGWWDSYSDVLNPELSALIGMETEARSAQVWHLEVVPGLLQTEHYAREVNRGYGDMARLTPRQMERRVRARLARQRILYRDPPFQYSVVLDESALRRRIGSNAVMREQLDRLIQLAELPAVTLQVKPLDSLYEIVTSSFVLLHFGEVYATMLPDVVYVEGMTSNEFEDEAATFTYQLAFDSLRRSALDSQQSLERIADIARHTWT